MQMMKKHARKRKEANGKNKVKQQEEEVKVE
jgi:hypothetical protein